MNSTSNSSGTCARRSTHPPDPRLDAPRCVPAENVALDSRRVPSPTRRSEGWVLRIGSRRLIGRTLRHVPRTGRIDEERIVDLARAVSEKKLSIGILKPLVPAALADPASDLEGLPERIDYRRPHTEANIEAAIERLRRELDGSGLASDDARNWMMGRLRPIALGNVPLRDVAVAVVEEALR